MIDNKDDGSGARGAGSVRQKSKTNGHCNICGQKLLLIFFRPNRNAHVCNDIHCSIFASPQFYTEIPDEQLQPRLSPTRYLALITRDSPSYRSYLEKRKQNYRCLRDLGVASVEACRMTSNKQTKACRMTSNKQTRAYVESKGLVY